MWLTGFDAPCLHTMYVDKPMRGHGLMQAIARVNRVFQDKPGGLVVDYLGLADQLKKALAHYTERRPGEIGIDQDEAVAVMLEKHEVIAAMFHGFDYSAIFSDNPAARIGVISATMDHILEQDHRTARPTSPTAWPAGSQRGQPALQGVRPGRAADEALGIRDDVGFFQAVRAGLAKYSRRSAPSRPRTSTTRSARSSPRPSPPTG